MSQYDQTIDEQGIMVYQQPQNQLKSINIPTKGSKNVHRKLIG